MKKIIATSVFAMAVASANAAPLVTIGDQLDVFFRGGVTGQWNSNVAYSHINKINDYSTVIRLGAEANYGRNSKFKANVRFFEDLTRYASKSEFNSNLAHVRAIASYTEQVLSLKANFSFDQNYQNSKTTIGANQAGVLVRSDAYNAGLTAAYNVSDKLDVEIGGNWQRIAYVDEWKEVYSDYDMYAIPVSVYYKVTPKIAAGLTYQYRYLEFSGGAAADRAFYGTKRQDHFAGLTLRGELAPKLSSEIFFGGTVRDASGGTDAEDDSTMSFKANFGYELSEKVGLFASCFRDFGNGASRQSSIDTGCEFGANYHFSTFLHGVASFAYENSDYEIYRGGDREDDTYIARIGLKYVPNKFLTFSANYRFLENSSSIASANYNQHLIDFSVMVKY